MIAHISIGTDNTLLALDSSIYSLSAVQRTAYDLAGQHALYLEKEGDRILVKSAGVRSKVAFEREEFLLSVLDHQLRLDLESQYAAIREIIIAQALQPRDDLAAVLSAHRYAAPPEESI